MLNTRQKLKIKVTKASGFKNLSIMCTTTLVPQLMANFVRATFSIYSSPWKISVARETLCCIGYSFGFDSLKIRFDVDSSVVCASVAPRYELYEALIHMGS